MKASTAAVDVSDPALARAAQGFGLDARQLRDGGAEWTAREIAQQSQLWPQIARLAAADGELTQFLAPLAAESALRVILTGAGTSAFVGECLVPTLCRKSQWRAAAIATTDLVASPDSFLAADVPTLLVSFARSGNSPESLAAVEQAQQRVRRCFHLAITCSREGQLYQRVTALNNGRALLLPDATNDRGFAMTSSFTGMLLAGAVALDVLPRAAERAATLSRLADQILPQQAPLLRELAAGGYQRVVYLGAAELKALAREAALKMLELTDGRVVASAETPLGFRHGPKTIVTRDTLVIVFVSSDPYTRRYDLDLIAELRRDAVAARVLTLSARQAAGCEPAAGKDDIVLDVPALAAGAIDARPPLGDLELGLPYVVFAQSLALLTSMAHSRRPDTPNAQGTVNRVVQGVTIHPWRPTP